MYKIVLAGCGGISNVWLDILTKREDCVLVGLCDIVPAHAEQQRAKYHLNVPIYEKLSDAIGNTTPDLVIDNTPPDAHYSIVTTALNAGCDVFGEKPMSDTLEHAEAMVACADATGKSYFVMQNYRYAPGIVALKRFIASGIPGAIGHISANFQIGVHFGGFRDEMASPLIADMAIHTFDASRYIAGLNPVAVYAHEYNPSWSWYNGDANAACIFELDNGAVLDYRGSWCAKGLNTSWNSEWRISCEHGGISWDGGSVLRYQTEDGDVQELPIDTDIVTGHAACIGEMFDALANGTRPQTDCRDNIHSIRMVYKAIESARLKQRIPL